MGGVAVGSLFALIAAAVLAAQNPASMRWQSEAIRATARDRLLLRAWDARIDRMVRAGDLVRTRVHPDTLLPGRTHERYTQYVNGVLVVGGDVSRQVFNGTTESIFGHIHDLSGIRTQPTISEDEVRGLIEARSGSTLPPGRRVALAILPRSDGSAALVYRTHVWRDHKWMRTYVDAHNGQTVLEYNDLQTQAAVGTGTGVLGDTKKISTRAVGGSYAADDQLRPPALITYDMRGDWEKTDRYLSGFYQPSASDLASDSDNIWTDGANVDAHVYLGWTYDYYFKRFGRRGLDDRDAPIYGITHPVRRTDLAILPDSVVSDYVLNAFWCPGCGPEGYGAMVFGEGLPPGITLGGLTFDFFSGALDVVAHELTHALTSYSSDLIYLNESGALNESFSDVIGASTEHFYESVDGLPPGDYLIGEDVLRPGGARSMANPGAFGDPDHYSRRFSGEDDNGGVHTNSGIPNHAFYLAIEGGVNRTSGLNVEGVGAGNREQIEKVFYRAFVFMLPSNATFSTARAATTQAARDLYGTGSAVERAIVQAWTAVGVQ